MLSGSADAATIGVSRADLDAFFMCLALCHTVVPERDTPDGPITYQAESPDEGALVQVSIGALRGEGLTVWISDIGGGCDGMCVGTAVMFWRFPGRGLAGLQVYASNNRC